MSGPLSPNNRNYLEQFGILDPRAQAARQRQLAEEARQYGSEFPGLLAPWDAPLEANAMMAAPIPVLGDVLGLAADAKMYATEPESRTLANFGLTAAGVLPFVPAAAAVRGIADAGGGGARTARKTDAQRLAKALDDMGLNYERKTSGLSGSEYFEVKPIDDSLSSFKVRVSDHNLPTYYGQQHGWADVEIGPHEDAVDYLSGVESIAKKAGARSPKSVIAARKAATTKAAKRFNESPISSDYRRKILQEQWNLVEKARREDQRIFPLFNKAAQTRSDADQQAYWNKMNEIFGEDWRVMPESFAQKSYEDDPMEWFLGDADATLNTPPNPLDMSTAARKATQTTNSINSKSVEDVSQAVRQRLKERFPESEINIKRSENAVGKSNYLKIQDGPLAGMEFRVSDHGYGPARFGMHDADFFVGKDVSFEQIDRTLDRLLQDRETANKKANLKNLEQSHRDNFIGNLSESDEAIVKKYRNKNRGRKPIDENDISIAFRAQVKKTKKEKDRLKFLNESILR